MKKQVLYGAPVVLALLLAGDLARADGPKYNRKTKDIKASATELTGKLVPKDVKEPGGPDKSLTADKFIQIETAIQGDIDVLIKEYKERLEDLEPDDSRRLEYGFRLAEALSKAQQFHHAMSMEALNNAEKAKTPADKKKFQDTQAREAAKEKASLIDAIKAYAALTTNPRISSYKDADAIFFFYGFTLQTAGRIPEAEVPYKTLLRDYQGSRFIPDVYFFFADRYFENRDLGNAEIFYKKVIELKNKSPLYPLALYKLAWVYYNEKRLADGKSALSQVIQITASGKGGESLNKSAKKDFVRFYAEGDFPIDNEAAYKAFQNIDKTEYSFKMYNLLGDFFMDEGKAAKAIYVFHDLMAKKPKAVELCEWQENVTRATMTIGTNPDKIRELSSLVKLYTALKTTKGIPQQNLDECREKAAGTTGELAALWHMEGLKTLNQQTLDNSEKLYHVYLDNFQDASNFMEMKVNYAELLWSLAAMEKDPKVATNRWEATAGAHCSIAQMKETSDAQRKDSANACVLAWKNKLGVDPGTDVNDKEENLDTVPPPEPIPDQEQQMMKAFELYLTYIKDEKDVERVSILFFTCRIYWKHKHFDEAIKFCSEVVDKHPEHETAYFAAVVLLNSLDRAQKGSDLVKTVEKMLANQQLLAKHGQLKPYLIQLAGNSRKKEAIDYAKAKRWRECYEANYKLQQDNPDDPDINKILENLRDCARNSHRMGMAIVAGKKLVERPGNEKDPIAQKAQFYLGDDYFTIARYEEAAEMYEKYADKFAGEADAPKALFYARFIRLGRGDDDKAIKDTDMYARDFAKTKPKEAARAEFSIADIYLKNKDYDKYIAYLEGWLRQWGSKAGVDYEIAAHVRIGEVLWRQSCPVKGENESCLTISRESSLKKTGGQKRQQQQTQCGDPDKNKITLYERKPGVAKQAQDHFARAIQLWRKGDALKDISATDEQEKARATGTAINYVAEAMFYQNEPKYEALLGVKPPGGLRFSTPQQSEASGKKFKKWKDDKYAIATGVARKYQDIVDIAVSGGLNINAAAWGIAAAAREAQVNQNFADELFTFEIPKEVRGTQDEIDAYCDALTDAANPLEDSAVKGYTFCLEQSNKLNWFSSWSRLCEAELAQIKPQDFPAAGEIRASADHVANMIDSQTIIAELPDTTVMVTPTINTKDIKTPPPKDDKKGGKPGKGTK